MHVILFLVVLVLASPLVLYASPVIIYLMPFILVGLGLSIYADFIRYRERAKKH